MVLLAALIAAPLIAQAPVRGGALPGPLPLFPADNWWNVDVSGAPVDPASEAFIQFIGPTRGMHPDFGGDSGATPPASLIYGMPYIVVAGTQPLEQVTFDYASESDYAAPGRPPGYPIPQEAKTETKWIEGGLAGGDSRASGDRHMLIVDRDHRLLFELYALRWNATLSRWEAGSGAIFQLDSNGRRPEGWTSADAAGLAILPGLVRWDEVYGTAPIRHAFRVTVRATNGYVYPASHRAGSTSGALPMGARLRLKQSKDISSFPEEVRRIFQAMKTYGLIVADNGSDLYVTGTYDTRWNNTVLNPAFRAIKASDFEVVQRGWKPQAPAPCTPPRISVEPDDVQIVRGQAAVLSAVATGSAPLAHQWYAGEVRPDTAIAGANEATLVFFPASTTSVRLRVSNSCGSITSREVALQVRELRRRPVRGPGG
jgi:hypothetical protein